MMSRKFTAREKVLLLVLAILLVCSGYYILVDQPVSSTIQLAQLREEDAQSQLMIEEARSQRLHQMEQELAALDTGSSASLAKIPDYDNVQNVVRLLNGALSASGGYNLVFSPVTFSGHIASRTIDMSFTCGGYAAAKSIVSQLSGAPYRSQITGLTLVSDGENGELTTSHLSAKLTITFFEYTQEAASEKAAS